MAKLCKNCNKYPVFGGGYCKYCQYLRTDKKETIKKTYKPPNKVSKKRKEQLDTYYQIKEDMLLKAKSEGNFRCFFCNNYFDKDYIPDIHHLKGKENEKLTDIQNLVLAHRSCHTIYHSSTMEQISKYDWYQGLLQRLKKS